MKKKIKLLGIFLLTSFLAGCTNNFNYYEDKLYNENIIVGEKTNTPPQRSSSILTRENAIKKALEIFDKGLNIKIDRSQFTESIKLIRDNEYSTLKWQITWYKSTEKIFYNCTFDSTNGEVLEIYNTDIKYYKNEPLVKLSPDEINEIIKPLFNELGLDIKDYKQALPSTLKKQELDYSNNNLQIFMSTVKGTKKTLLININCLKKTVTLFSVYNKLT